MVNLKASHLFSFHFIHLPAFVDVCSKPGICGKGAVCKPVNSKAECECLPGYRGNPYVECSISM